MQIHSFNVYLIFQALVLSAFLVSRSLWLINKINKSDWQTFVMHIFSSLLAFARYTNTQQPSTIVHLTIVVAHGTASTWINVIKWLFFGRFLCWRWTSLFHSLMTTMSHCRFVYICDFNECLLYINKERQRRSTNIDSSSKRSSDREREQHSGIKAMCGL